MNKYTKIVIMAALFAATYLITLHLLTPPYVKIFSGSTGTTTTELFTIVKPSWDIQITYFKRWGTFWRLRVEVYGVGSDTPVFTTYVYLLTEPGGGERAELNSHPSLPPGRYYLKVFSDNVNWSLRIVEWEA